MNRFSNIISTEVPPRAHTQPIKVAESGPDTSISYGLAREVRQKYKAWLQRRGLVDQNVNHRIH